MGKNLPACNARDIRDAGSIPGLGSSPGGGHDNPLQYSCLENPMGRGAWQAAVPGVAGVGHDCTTRPPPQSFTDLVFSILGPYVSHMSL